MRVAIVGAGTMGRRHAGVVLRNGRCRLAVVVDIHRERAATVAVEAGCLATDRLEPALACDVAVIATPSDRHTEAAVAFLEAGKPVLIEKPLAENMTDVQRVVDISERLGVPVVCGFVERFNPVVPAAASLLRESPLRMLARRQSPPMPHIRTSVVHDLLIHDIDLAIGFSRGTALERINLLAAPVPSADGARDAAGCVLDFADGTVATLSADRCSPVRIRTFTIETPSELIELDLARRELTAYDLAHGTLRRWPAADEEGGALDRQFAHFLDVLEGGKDADHERRRLVAPHLVTTHLTRR